MVSTERDREREREKHMESHVRSPATTPSLQLQFLQATKARRAKFITVRHRPQLLSCEIKSFRGQNPQWTCSQSHFWSQNKRIRVICKSSEQGSYNEEVAFSLKRLTTVPGYIFGFVRRNYLPSVLLSAVLLGLAFPKLGQRAFGLGLSKHATFGMFFISGLMLQTQELNTAMESWPYLLFGLASVLLLTPLMSTLVFQIPIVPQELVTGLAIFCCVPTTLSSGTSLSQLAGANTAMALSLTVSSNILGILTVPFMVSRLVAGGLGISMPVGPLMTSLMLTLVVPLLLGKACREYIPGFGTIVNNQKELLSIISSQCLAIVPFMQIGCARDSLLTLKISNLVMVAFIGVIIHVVFLLSNIIGVEALGMLKGIKENKRISWAIVITASQKTLPISIAVIGSISGLMGEAGLLVLPCLIAHITQVVFDSFLVSTYCWISVLVFVDTCAWCRQINVLEVFIVLSGLK